MTMRDIEHCFFERICPFVCVILTTIHADATVASKINGFELATAFALICKVTAILVLAGKHFVDFFDLNIAKMSLRLRQNCSQLPLSSNIRLTVRVCLDEKIVVCNNEMNLHRT